MRETFRKKRQIDDVDSGQGQTTMFGFAVLIKLFVFEGTYGRLCYIFAVSSEMVQAGRMCSRTNSEAHFTMVWEHV